ncbi:MAG: hypothetical protein WCW02_01755 [Candidatus Buchananbacteria bacterium]
MDDLITNHQDFIRAKRIAFVVLLIVILVSLVWPTTAIAILILMVAIGALNYACAQEAAKIFQTTSDKTIREKYYQEYSKELKLSIFWALSFLITLALIVLT